MTSSSSRGERTKFQKRCGNRMRRSWAAALLGIVGLCVSAAFAGDTGLARDPDWELGRKYLAEGKTPEAHELLTRLAQKYPAEPDIQLFLARAALRSRDPQAAASAIDKTLSLDPNHLEARTLRGWVEMEVKHDYNAAVTDY